MYRRIYRQAPQRSTSHVHNTVPTRSIARPVVSSVDSRLASLGLRRHETRKDGNCLFHAVSFLLNQKAIAHVDHVQLRKDVCNYIALNVKLFEIDIIVEYGTVENFLKIMQTPGKYACNIVLTALSFLFDVNFCVHFPTQMHQTYPSETRPNLHILFTRRSSQRDGHWEATEAL